MNITNQEYWIEIESLANQCAEEAKESDRDLSDVIFEELDSHQWVIYYEYHYDILKSTDYQGYYIEEFGTDGGSFEDIMMRSAFWAMYNDIINYEI